MGRRIVKTKNIEIEELENKSLLAVSDVHLGQRDKERKEVEYSDKSKFQSFLKKIEEKAIECDYFIICGDFLDMWRRDMVGVVIENTDIFHLLKSIKDKGTEVIFIIGNHDYYLRHILEINYGYEFSFYNGIKLIDKGNGLKYIFVHGDEFDEMQNELFYDILCYSNDHSGSQMDSIWNFFLKNRNWLKRIWDRIIKGQILEGFQELLKSAEKRFEDTRMIKVDNTFRLTDPLPNLEQQALNYGKTNGQLLVFGHTHQPFIHKDEESKVVIANTGTWVNLNEIHNTYIRVKNKKIELRRYEEENSLDEITL